MEIDRESGCPKSDASLKVFVYGTLQEGQSNHARCCAGVGAIERAWVDGRLFDLPWGFPALQVLDSSVFARGTADRRADWEAQLRLVPVVAVSGPGIDRVHGQLLSFDKPDDVLRRLDHLEGFHPGSESLYERVLLCVGTDSGARMAWTYVMRVLPSGARPLPEGHWPPSRPAGD